MARPDSDSPHRPPHPASDGDSYDLADFDAPVSRPPPAAFPADEPETPTETERPARPRRPRRPATPEPDQAERDAALVGEVWSRQAESLPTLARIAVVALIVVFLIYGAFSAGQVGLGFLLLLLGGFVCVLLSYPLAITLEAPLRLTPEQAVKDFFGALSHHIPHYRRMWLLLSDVGRSSGPFGSLGEFREYWKARLDAWHRAAGLPRTRPLAFHVSEFKSEKSAGKSSVEATVTVQVRARGEDSGPPIAEYRYRLDLVKGPDRMWYLNEGSIPSGDPA